MSNDLGPMPEPTTEDPELVPGGTLTGLAKRALPGVELLALKGPDDLDAARDLVARHTGAEQDQQPPHTQQSTQPRSDPA